ncbi:hypothetical protein GCM10007320_30350 [Pseudorhodoferax aquiterrae]|uniref:Uncharacterized protein n=1 Tax=Pseudorhodoferax aquiterrae TaxID=747304 RepID=A0ABQ3G2H8_9BURK|nr:hypothetical protein GCM10007320_30350 [Pseudorhodoferax aquiterrae]
MGWTAFDNHLPAALGHIGPMASRQRWRAAQGEPPPENPAAYTAPQGPLQRQVHALFLRVVAWRTAVKPPSYVAAQIASHTSGIAPQEFP